MVSASGRRMTLVIALRLELSDQRHRLVRRLEEGRGAHDDDRQSKVAGRGDDMEQAVVPLNLRRRLDQKGGAAGARHQLDPPATPQINDVAALVPVELADERHGPANAFEKGFRCHCPDQGNVSAFVGQEKHSLPELDRGNVLAHVYWLAGQIPTSHTPDSSWLHAEQQGNGLRDASLIKPITNMVLAA
jgi:hypothetical protein